jgi:hypothetical protein
MRADDGGAALPELFAWPAMGIGAMGKTDQLYTPVHQALSGGIRVFRLSWWYHFGPNSGARYAMKNLFERDAVDEVVTRIGTLEATSARQWGKMNAAQMMAHCSAALDMAAGRLNPPRILIGRLIGGLVKPHYTNEKPFARNNPTDKKLVVSDERDFLREQEQLRAKVKQFHEGGEAKCTRHPHPFFGALTPQEWSRGMYKHLDHHLRQFGA